MGATRVPDTKPFELFVEEDTGLPLQESVLESARSREKHEVELARLILRERGVGLLPGHEDSSEFGIRAELNTKLRDGVRDRLKGGGANGASVLAYLNREVDE
jgi:hypothetical protein